MFGFGKKKPGPARCPGNPGVGVEAKVACSGSRQGSQPLAGVEAARPTPPVTRTCRHPTPEGVAAAFRAERFTNADWT